MTGLCCPHVSSGIGDLPSVCGSDFWIWIKCRACTRMLSPVSSGLFCLLSLPPLHRNRLNLAYFNKRKVLALCSSPPSLHPPPLLYSQPTWKHSKWFLFLMSHSFLVTQWDWLPLKSVCQDQEGSSYKSSKLHAGQTVPILWSTVFPVASTMPATQWVLSKSLLNVSWCDVLFDLGSLRMIEILPPFHSHDILRAGFCLTHLGHPFSSSSSLFSSLQYWCSDSILSLLLIFIHLSWESRHSAFSFTWFSYQYLK